MGKNKSASRALTQEEIWDDSALVQSWDEAVEEYKLYHSIHAKGENVEDVLREAEAEAEADAGTVAVNTQTQAQDENDDDMADADAVEPTAQRAQVQPSEKQPNGVGAASTGPAAAPPMRQPVLAPVQDEGLKNLMMSWYYAGYYTGLYEGQQRANQNNKSS